MERHLGQLLAAGDGIKFFEYQRSLLNQLKHILSLRCEKFAGVGKSTADAVSKAAPSVSPAITHLGVLNVAANTRLGSGRSALAECQALLKERPLDVGLALASVQLAVRERNLGTASSIVQNLLDALERTHDPGSRKLRYAPGLVALAVALHRAQGKSSPALAELSGVVSHSSDSQGSLSISLLREAGLELIKSHRIDDVRHASTAFESILNTLSNDDLAAAGLVASSGNLDDETAASLSAALLPVEELVSGANVEELLEGGVIGSSSATQLKRRMAEEPERPAKKRRRRVPKNAEPGKELDPERWLPLRDRSSFKPKGKKGRKRVADSTQGGIVKEETIELVGGAGAVKVEKTTSASRKKKKGRK